MIEIVNNHFKSLLNDLLIKAYYEKPISTYSNGFRWECVQIIKRIHNFLKRCRCSAHNNQKSGYPEHHFMKQK